MVRIITYGTYDMLHYGHIRLLERAKELGDYLIVGITSDDFDKSRGKINVQQSLAERIDAVRATGLADEIIVEEYEGQKIDDIIRYNIDIFTVGSDWTGHFDYLNEYCRVIYLERTQGISSSQLRSEKHRIRMGFVGDNIPVIDKTIRETEFVNGLQVTGICCPNGVELTDRLKKLNQYKYDKLLEIVDAVYIAVHPSQHDSYIRKALDRKKHILCETPISITSKDCKDYFEIADRNHVILMEGIKTAYSLAYERLLLLLKTGIIGDIVSIDTSCTSLKPPKLFSNEGIRQWGSMHAWGPFAMLPVFNILGCEYIEKTVQSKILEENYDLFTRISFLYEHAVATVKVGNGVKTEGEMIISGTKGYVYVPAPWWKTDYFEVRFENPQENRRYFYQLEGEGIRYMIVNFLKTISGTSKKSVVSRDVSFAISKVMEEFENQKNVKYL